MGAANLDKMVEQNKDFLKCVRGENIANVLKDGRKWGLGWCYSAGGPMIPARDTNRNQRLLELAPSLRRPFRPGWYHEPGPKVRFKPVEATAGALHDRTGTRAPIGTGS